MFGAEIGWEKRNERYRGAKPGRAFKVSERRYMKARKEKVSVRLLRHGPEVTKAEVTKTKGCILLTLCRKKWRALAKGLESRSSPSQTL